MSILMAKFSDHGVQVLDDTGNGWRTPDDLEWIGTEGGNYLSFNADGYATGWVHGLASGVLVALFTIGIVAVMVVQ